MKQPPGFVVEGKEDHVLRLVRSIYGLKQSARVYYELYNGHAQEAGYKRLQSDMCVYSLERSPSNKAFIGVHVDDMKYACSRGSKLVDEFIAFMQDKGLKIKNLGPIHHLLGVEFVRDREKREITLTQRAYIDSVLERFRFSVDGLKGRDTPFKAGYIASKAQSPDIDDSHLREQMEKHPYKSILGSLMYLAIWTRPDIAYAVTSLAQFSTNPGPEHWEQLKHLLRYVRKTRDYGLKLGGKETIDPFGFADADWGSHPDHRHSISGYAFFLSQDTGAISWSSKKQPTVALSSAEAEYMALGRATQEALWLRSFLGELGFVFNSATTIHSDNIGAIELSENDVHHQRTKHIDIRHHFIRKHVKDKQVSPEFIPTERQTADLFTKSLPKVKHELHTKSLGLAQI